MSRAATANKFPQRFLPSLYQTSLWGFFIFIFIFIKNKVLRNYVTSKGPHLPCTRRRCTLPYPPRSILCRPPPCSPVVPLSSRRRRIAGCRWQCRAAASSQGSTTLPAASVRCRCPGFARRGRSKRTAWPGRDADTI